MDHQPPGYSLSMLDTFITYTGDDLNRHCTETYSGDWQVKTTNMAADLDGMISNGNLCADLQGKYSVLLPSSSFNPVGSEVTQCR